VFAIDLDHRALRTLPTGPTYERQGRIIPVLADVSSELPLSHEALDLALAVHCSVHDHLSAIEAALAPGGLLIYETFGGQGRNWQELPKGGQLRSTLKSRFEILELHERRVGPAGKGHVAVKVFARKQGI
jgi:SAM-dependent methyltransferase